MGLSLVVTLAYQLFNSEEEPVEIDPSELLISEKKDVPDQVPANPVVQVENNQLKLAAIGPIDRLIVCDEGVTPKKYHEFKNLPSGWEKQSNLRNHLDAIVHHLKTCGLPWMMVQKKSLMAWVLKLSVGVSKDYLRALGVILRDKVLLSLRRRCKLIILSGTVLPMALV